MREEEARALSGGFPEGSEKTQVEVMSFRDGFFPEHGEAIKSWFEALKSRVNPDVIFTHYRDDAHQDHRHVCRLTWNTFRDHCILEYEIPKWDGDMGQPNVYMPVSAAALERKIELLNSHFGSQRSKQWFDAETFHGLARLERHGMSGVGTLCRSVLCAKAYSNLTGSRPSRLEGCRAEPKT